MKLITGSTGNVGAEVCKFLDDNEYIRAISSEPKNANERKFDFLDPSTFSSALTGITQVFLIRPPQLAKPEQDMRPFIQYCKLCNIEHIVFLSLQGVHNNAFTPHAKIEKMIKEIGIAYTFLRPSFFMQNLTMQHAQEIQQKDCLFMPAGKGKTNFIDVHDIACVASIVLTQSSDHINKAYTLTGDQSFDYFTVAELLSKTLERKIVYKNPGLFRYWIAKIIEGQPFSYTLVTGIIYTIARLGKADGYSDDLKNILKRKPNTLNNFIHEHKKVWIK